MCVRMLSERVCIYLQAAGMTHRALKLYQIKEILFVKIRFFIDIATVQCVYTLIKFTGLQY